jgi:hypothetical protein
MTLREAAEQGDEAALARGNGGRLPGRSRPNAALRPGSECRVT